MARLHADENFSFPVVELLRQLGHDVRTTGQADMANQRLPDADVLARATADGRAVLTFNRRHFKRLHQVTGLHAGIIVCTREDDVAALARRIDQAIAATGPLDNQLLIVNKPP
jgi:hypothetical protein